MFTNKELSPEGIYEITPKELRQHLDKVVIIDVRRPDEWTAELGHIEGAKLCTLGTELTQELKKLPVDSTYVFVCRSGMRSLRAGLEAFQMGFKNVYNLRGGMLAWNSSN